MISKKCNQTGIKNYANGKEFYFCRDCRIEITLEEVETKDSMTQQEIDDMLYDFYYLNKHSYLQIYQDYEQECLSISPHWSDRD